MRRADPDFVVGKRPPYKVQPAIVHPRRCSCSRCSALTDDERRALACRKICCLSRPIEDREIVIRVQRASLFPSSRTKSAAFAADLKTRLEAELVANLRYAPATPAQMMMQLTEIAELYFAANPRNVSPETLTRERISAANVLRVLALVAPDVPPDEISEPEAVAFRNHRDRVDSAADRTIGGELTFLKMLLEFGFRWRAQTGMAGVRLLSIPAVGDEQREGIALTVDEFRELLAAVSPINRRRLIFASTTLLRRTPLLGLHQDWTDLTTRWLSVPAAVQKKGRAKRRYPLEVPMSRWAAAQLEGLTPWHGYWWPNTVTHQPLTWIDHIFSAIRKEVKIVRHGEPAQIRLHDLRYTGISWLRHAGVDEMAVAILAGQRSTYDPSSSQTTTYGGSVTRNYTRVYESTLRDAVAVQDEIRRQVERPAVRMVAR